MVPCSLPSLIAPSLIQHSTHSTTRMMMMTTTTSSKASSSGRRAAGLWVRRVDGFQRYAVAIQYHGGNLLGFSYQPNQELESDTHDDDNNNNNSSSSTTAAAVTSVRSVERRLRQAFRDTFPSSKEALFENIQVSSRTDRGVHAWRNTLHVDIRQPQQQYYFDDSHNSSNFRNCSPQKMVQRLIRGVNFHLSRQQQTQPQTIDVGTDEDAEWKRGQRQRRQQQQKQRQQQKHHLNLYNDIRILSAAPAPLFMSNKEYQSEVDPSQPEIIDWNARFSATQRTYVYRILWYPKAQQHQSDGDNDYAYYASNMNLGIPFEWDRSWRIRSHQMLDVSKMQRAANHLLGTHDFSSFRGSGCQRQSAVVTMRDIQVSSQPYSSFFGVGVGGVLGWGNTTTFGDNSSSNGPHLITISMTGNAFLYRQVRNMVGCLVEVGRGGTSKLRAEDIPDLLQAKQRPSSSSYSTAPAHGLYLMDVRHGDFYF